MMESELNKQHPETDRRCAESLRSFLTEIDPNIWHCERDQHSTYSIRKLLGILYRQGLIRNDGSGWELTPRPDVKGLEELYHTLYRNIQWPKPIPSPNRVLFKWNSRSKAVRGTCYPVRELKTMVIAVNFIYQDERLKEELEYLMLHEAAHFIWLNHNKEFKTFLRSIGVRDDYINGSGAPMTELVQTVLFARELPKPGG